MSALIIILGALCSTLGTLALKRSDRFRNRRYTGLALTGYAGSTWFLAQAMHHMPVALAHAAWSGLVAVALLAVDRLYLKTRLAAGQVSGFFFILAGIATLSVAP